MSGAPRHPLLEAGRELAHALEGVLAFRFSLAAASQAFPPLHSLLMPEERERAARPLRQDDRLRATATRAVLRVQLGAMLDRDPASLEFDNPPQGKPRLADGVLSFNVSHSADSLVIAVSQRREVGADVERIDLERDVDSAVRFALSADELVALDALPIDRRKLGFLRLWTAKEAALKGLGVGMRRPMREAAIDPRGLATLDGSPCWRPHAATIDGEVVELADASLDDDVICLAALQPHAPGANSFG